MPKSGGSSFKKMLEDHFGNDFKGDYRDYPLHKSDRFRHGHAEAKRFTNSVRYPIFKKYSKIECIHGHYLPYKYSCFIEDKDNVFVTWLRDPIERIASHYFYWKRTYDPKKARVLQRKVVEDDWSFEKFAFSEQMKNVYSKFLWRFPISRLDFIGIVEFAEEDTSYFSKTFLKNSSLRLPSLNVNQDRVTKYVEDIDTIRRLKLHHNDDYGLYNYALHQRKNRP
jgi:hypothetical protein